MSIDGHSLLLLVLSVIIIIVTTLDYWLRWKQKKQYKLEMRYENDGVRFSCALTTKEYEALEDFIKGLGLEEKDIEKIKIKEVKNGK